MLTNPQPSRTLISTLTDGQPSTLIRLYVGGGLMRVNDGWQPSRPKSHSCRKTTRIRNLMNSHQPAPSKSTTIPAPVPATGSFRIPAFFGTRGGKFTAAPGLPQRVRDTLLGAIR
jgi:hypothetical protein